MRRFRYVLSVIVAAGAGGACASGGSGGGAATLPDGVAFSSVATVELAGTTDPGAGLPDPPAIVVTDDGRVVLPTPPSAAVAGELVPQFWTLPVPADGVERLVDAAAAGEELFAGDRDQHLGRLREVVAPAQLGELRFYFAEEFLVAATPSVDPAGRPVVAWPSSADVSLADVGSCAVVPEAQVGEALATAAAGSAFDDGGVLFDVVALPAWPGATC